MDKAPAARIALDNASLNNLGKWMVMLILGVRCIFLMTTMKLIWVVLATKGLGLESPKLNM